MPPSSALPIEAGISADFEFEDERYLRAGQNRGGLVYVPPGVPLVTRVPLVVVLHGTNDRGAMHLWFDADGARRDLRPFLDGLLREGGLPPFAIAAPSQTRDASRGRTLWNDFDLWAFVSSAERAMEGRVLVDRSRVVVVGHSGAGCNPEGGLRSMAASPAVGPFALVAVDTCLDVEGAEDLARSRAPRGVWVYWQTSQWARPFDDFRAAFERASVGAGGERHAGPIDVTGDDPHDDIVPEALGRALRAIFGTPDL